MSCPRINFEVMFFSKVFFNKKKSISLKCRAIFMRYDIHVGFMRVVHVCQFQFQFLFSIFIPQRWRTCWMHDGLHIYAWCAHIAHWRGPGILKNVNVCIIIYLWTRPSSWAMRQTSRLPRWSIKPCFLHAVFAIVWRWRFVVWDASACWYRTTGRRTRRA